MAPSLTVQDSGCSLAFQPSSVDPSKMRIQGSFLSGLSVLLAAKDSEARATRSKVRIQWQFNIAARASMIAASLTAHQHDSAEHQQGSRGAASADSLVQQKFRGNGLKDEARGRGRHGETQRLGLDQRHEREKRHGHAG